MQSALAIHADIRWVEGASATFTAAKVAGIPPPSEVEAFLAHYGK